MIDRGGAAFPHIEEQETGDEGRIVRIYHEGMTLRDYFGGQALAGMLGNPGIRITKVTDIANEVYNMADAMIKEHNK